MRRPRRARGGVVPAQVQKAMVPVDDVALAPATTERRQVRRGVSCQVSHGRQGAAAHAYVEGTASPRTLQDPPRRPILVASTSEMYGKSTDLPFREDSDLVLGPDDEGPLVLRLLEGDRRVPGARLLEERKPRASSQARPRPGRRTRRSWPRGRPHPRPPGLETRSGASLADSKSLASRPPSEMREGRRGQSRARPSPPLCEEAVRR